jgi:PDZ domain-containing secreted protein
LPNTRQTKQHENIKNKLKWGIILLLLIMITSLAFYPSKPQAPIAV